MVRIKINFFESLATLLLLPNIGIVFTTIVLIISLVVKQEPVIYWGIIISYCVCFLLVILTVLICILANRVSKKEFILYDDCFYFLEHQYLTRQIISCKYYVCKWYAIPIAFIYKQQVAGLLEIRLNTGEKIQFKIFYNDFLKLKKKIKSIVEK